MDADYKKTEEPAHLPVVVEPEAPTAESARGANGRYSSPAAVKTENTAAEQAWFDKMKAGMKETLIPGSTEQAQDEKAKADAPEVATESKNDDVDKEALSAALLDAKRLKIPAKALEAMSHSELVQAGRDWKAQIAESGKLSQKFGEMEKQIEAMKAGKVAASPSGDQPADDLDALVQPFVADYDESTRNSLKGIVNVIRSQSKSEVSSLKGELAEMKEALGQLQVANGLAAAEGIRGELKGKFPQLGKAGNWNAVLTRANALSQLPEYKGNPREAIEHAARIECASSMPVEQVSESNRGKRNGVASTSSTAPRIRSDSQEDRDRAVYNRIFNVT